jgi:hypothetical protein
VQVLQPSLGRVAGDDRAVDGADRHAREPVRQVALLVQGLVHAGLVGAERATALEDQRDPLASLRPAGRARLRRAVLAVRRSCAHPIIHPVILSLIFASLPPLSRRFTSLSAGRRRELDVLEQVHGGDLR